jgi:hypothetical protein
MTMGELASSLAPLADAPTDGIRIIALRRAVFDGIYRGDIPVSHPDVQNPLWIEEIPGDQHELAPVDKLLSVLFMRLTEDPKSGLEQVANQYLRIPPDEPFAETFPRLTDFDLGETVIELCSHFSDASPIPVNPDTILWDLIDESSILKVIYNSTAHCNV